MSIDDSFGRDPRVRRLARLLGWSRRETMGTLLDIFAICYDRANEFLPEVDVHECAAQDGLDCLGFVERMVDVGLATRHPHSRHMIRISGAEERIKYLRESSELGRRGGLKSAETRRKKAESRKKTPKGGLKGPFKQIPTPPSSDPQGSLKLPDTPPDPDPVVAPSPVPAGAPDHASAREHSPVRPVTDDPRDEETRRLMRVIAPLHVEVFNRLRTELGSQARPMAVVGDPAERALLDLIHGCPALDGFEDDARHVLEIRAAEARKKQTLQYLGTSVWNPTSFAKARSMTVSDIDDATGTDVYAAADTFFDRLANDPG